MSNNLEGLIANKIDYSQLEPLKVDVRDGVYHKYFGGAQCPDGMTEAGEFFVKVEESNHCKSTTVSMMVTGIALGAVSFGLGMQFLQNKDMIAGFSFTPPLVGAIAGILYSELCYYNYPDSKQAIWQGVKTCLVDEKIIGTGPIPEDSF
jgi:hypothetical protein